MSVPDANEPQLRRDLVAVCRRLSSVGLIGGGEGNVSARLHEGRLLTTPSGVNKALLEPDDLVITDAGGARLSGARAPSSELRMHLAVYRARPEVRAVVHAHPPTAVALTLAGLDLSQPMLPEAVTALGGCIPTAPYQSPSTEALAEGVALTLAGHDACLMERHGAIAVGRDVWEALDRMETVERLAQVLLRARQLGCAPAALPQDEVARLLKLSGRA